MWFNRVSTDSSCEGALMKSLFRLMILGCVLVTAMPFSLRAQQPAAKPTAEQVTFFEKSIRPILVRECYSCHATTAEKVRGGLLLDSRDAVRKGGDNGP